MATTNDAYCGFRLPKEIKEKLTILAAANKRDFSGEANLAFENHIKANEKLLKKAEA